MDGWTRAMVELPLAVDECADDSRWDEGIELALIAEWTLVAAVVRFPVDALWYVLELTPATELRSPVASLVGAVE